MLILILYSCLFMIIRRKHWYPADSRLYIQQTVTYARLCTASSVSYRQCRVIDNKREIFQRNETREILRKVDHRRWTTVQLITYMHLHRDEQVDLDMIIDDFLTLHRLMQVKNNE
jgi:hypothetical protein